MRANGIEPAAESLPPQPDNNDMDVARIVYRLCQLYPKHPHQIPFTEIVAACNFYETDTEAVDQIIDIIAAINIGKEPKEEPKGYVQ